MQIWAFFMPCCQLSSLLLVLQIKEEDMFGIFKKDPKKKLEDKYKALMEESYRLSTTNRAASDEKRAEAEEVLKELNKLDGA